MSIARFRVVGRFDKPDGPPIEGTLVIDRDSGTVTLRPLRRRSVFKGNINTLAETLVPRPPMRSEK